MKVNSTTIVALTVGIIMLLVLFKVLPAVIPTAALAVSDLFSATNLANATVVGDGPAALAATFPSLLGYFWVIVPFVLAIGLIMAIGRGGRR